jgi:hypothetical protein
MPSSPNSLPVSNELVENLEKALLADAREVYGDLPLTFFQTFHPQLKWPAKLRRIFADIWKRRVSHAIIKGPRGGGKSKLISALGFALWYFKNQSGIDMGGALEQAKEVYNYFTDYCYTGEGRLEGLPKDPTITHTESDTKKYFKCVTASPKQVRGPHPDFLLIDEACEAKDELILAALPMVNSSPDPVVVITSTFHKLFGLFQEIWDAAEEMGYARYSWDIFDVTKPFDPSIWDDPELNRVIPDFQELRKLAAGRTGDPEGWVPIENIIQAWRGKPSLDWFLVEMMGSRPSAAGLVLNPEDVDAAMFDDGGEHPYHYKQGAECTIGIDWGFSSMTAVTVWMRYRDDVKVMLEDKNYTQTPSETIIDDVLELIARYRVRNVYADIGGGKFENDALKTAIAKSATLKSMRHSCSVQEVEFQKDKEPMLGNLRAHFERRKVRIPQRFREAKIQLKSYQYQEGTNKPKKENDHIPDSIMCALKH